MPYMPCIPFIYASFTYTYVYIYIYIRMRRPGPARPGMDVSEGACLLGRRGFEGGALPRCKVLEGLQPTQVQGRIMFCFQSVVICLVVLGCRVAS